MGGPVKESGILLSPVPRGSQPPRLSLLSHIPGGQLGWGAGPGFLLGAVGQLEGSK